jgi:hypothetical protein
MSLSQQKALAAGVVDKPVVMPGTSSTPRRDASRVTLHMENGIRMNGSSVQVTSKLNGWLTVDSFRQELQAEVTVNGVIPKCKRVQP